MGLKSRSKFKSCAAGRKDLKGRGKDKGKSDVGPSTDPWIPTRVPFSWFLLRRQRTVLPHFKVRVMSATTSAYSQ